jgi:hypothetical protein
MPDTGFRQSAITYGTVGATGVPTYELISMPPYSYGRLVLPLASDGRRVDRILVCVNERPGTGLVGPTRLLRPTERAEFGARGQLRLV